MRLSDRFGRCCAVATRCLARHDKPRPGAIRRPLTRQAALVICSHSARWHVAVDWHSAFRIMNYRVQNFVGVRHWGRRDGGPNHLVCPNTAPGAKPGSGAGLRAWQASGRRFPGAAVSASRPPDFQHPIDHRPAGAGVAGRIEKPFEVAQVHHAGNAGIPPQGLSQ